MATVSKSSASLSLETVHATIILSMEKSPQTSQTSKTNISAQIVTQLSVLNQKLEHIDRKLNRLTSFTHNFALYVIRGLGYALGFTLIFALVISILAKILSPFLQSPFIQNVSNGLLKQPLEEIQNLPPTN